MKGKFVQPHWLPLCATYISSSPDVPQLVVTIVTLAAECVLAKYCNNWEEESSDCNIFFLFQMNNVIKKLGSLHLNDLSIPYPHCHHEAVCSQHWRKQLTHTTSGLIHEVNISPLVSICPLKLVTNVELQSGQDTGDDDEHTDELPWSGFWNSLAVQTNDSKWTSPSGLQTAVLKLKLCSVGCRLLGCLTSSASQLI